MLLWIFVIVMTFGILWMIFDWNYDGDTWGASILVSGLIGVGISIIILACSYIGVDGYIDTMNVRRDTLVYQYENDVYENDNDLGKRELMSDIQDWNEDLAMRRAIQDDFWIGIYMPNIYDQFDFIELEKGEGNDQT